MSDRVPLSPDDILVLRGEEFDPQELHRAITPLGLTAGLTTRWRLVEAEVKQLLVERGISYVWQLVRLQEAIMPPTPDVPALLAVLTQMLTRLSPTESFVVVDRYLLPKGRSSDYRGQLVSVLEPPAKCVESLTLVTDPTHDATFFEDLKTELSHRAPSCRLILHVSEKFHDRFWLADGARGLVVGTSLNGLGKRYALVDFMQPSDVRDVLQALKSEGFL